MNIKMSETLATEVVALCSRYIQRAETIVLNCEYLVEVLPERLVKDRARQFNHDVTVLRFLRTLIRVQQDALRAERGQELEGDPPDEGH